ncbi:small metal-binding protein SmbP [Methylogaea oryzae]|uniref:Uncharacterized protein n=1 Tax=Methylogaea oryzae TaxID=1295382 RepID=A0A8D4VQZ9_9GAMM|nr:small metal-binding protein SmbP [Methylogaea oryzae]BBL71657.1 hypothetical protein MoryE10_22630 [Methylogaea oryzae]
MYAKKFAAVLVAGALSLASVAAIAAEDAAGVLKHTREAVSSAKEALTHAQAGHKDQTLEVLKATKQHMKEVTGDYLGATLQHAQARLRSATTAAEKGDMPEATKFLEEAVTKLTDIEKKVAAQHN